MPSTSRDGLLFRRFTIAPWSALAKASMSTSLPGVDANRPDSPTALMAFVNAHRWTRLNRLRKAEGIEDEPPHQAVEALASRQVPVTRIGHLEPGQGRAVMR